MGREGEADEGTRHEWASRAGARARRADATPNPDGRTLQQEERRVQVRGANTQYCGRPVTKRQRTFTSPPSMMLRLPICRTPVRRIARVTLAAAACVAATQTAARAQAVIKVNDTVSVRFGVLLQPWLDESQDAGTRTYAQNLYLRRARILIGGQFGSKFSFFLDTDNPNLGRATGTAGKTISSGFILQDVYVDYHPSQEFTVQAGLMFPPSARNATETAAGLLPIDFGSYAFINGATLAENEVAGRDLGVQAKGYLFRNRVEYRAGIFQGARQSAATAAGLGSANPFRVAGRVQVAFLDPEVVAFLYPGLYFGRKRMFNLGVSYDAQQTLHSVTGDVFFDHPVGDAGAITVQGDVFRRDGGRYSVLPKQTDAYVEGGFLFRGPGVMPFARAEAQNISGNAAASQHRFQAGLAYFISGQNLTLKGAYGQVRPNTNQVTAQLQLFSY